MSDDMFDDLGEIITEFLEESESFIESLNEKLLEAEEHIKNGRDISAEDINTMFRAAHTLKGSSSMLGFENLSSLTHEMETLLDRVRNNKMPLTIEIIDVLFKAFDQLNSIMETLKSEGHDQADISEIYQEIHMMLDSGGASPQSKPTEEPKKASVHKTFTEEPKVYDLNDKIFQVFLMESDENLDLFESSLMSLEDDPSVEKLNDLFRFAHTLKGSAGVMKRHDIEELAHKAEDLLAISRDQNKVLDEKTISLLFESLDRIKSIIEQMRSGEFAWINVDDIVEQLIEVKNQNYSDSNTIEKKSQDKEGQREFHSTLDVKKMIEKHKERLLEAFHSGFELYVVNAKISETCNLKSVKAMILERELGQLGVVLDSAPLTSEIVDDSPGSLDLSLFVLSQRKVDDIAVHVDEIHIQSVLPISREQIRGEKPAKDAQQKSSGKTAKAQPAASKESNTIRVDSRKLDSLLNLAGELVITRARFVQLVNELDQQVDDVKGINQVASVINEQWAYLHSWISKNLHEKSSHEDISKVLKTVEQLHDHVTSLKGQISQKNLGHKVRNLDEATGSLGKLASDIQSGIMQTRMIAVENLFTRFKRVVRDVSKELDKDVVLEIYGEETELDKKIIDQLNDPLTHMIRNSLDHGLENKENRSKVNKSEYGTLRLGASHQGNNICIEVSDDGVGMDVDKITAKALEKNVVSPEQLESMSEKEKLNLIFAPGFSTAAQVTELSGRGVGMDVVRHMLDAVNGTVEINTELGQGSRFLLKIPLTLAIIQALLVKIDQDVFALPLEAVSEIIKIQSDDIYTVEGQRMIKLREHALALVELNEIIGLEGNQKQSVRQSYKVIVITDGSTQLGVVVDDLIGEDEIVIKALSEHFASVQGVSGASILGDGHIALILDPNTIIKLS